LRKQTVYLAVCAALAASIGPTAGAQTAITTPKAHFGFDLGADGTYAMWDEEVAYFQKLDKESDRVETRVLGKSTLGHPFLLVTISSPENLAKAARYKEIARQLADPRGLTPQQIDALAKEGRSVVLVTLGLHSTEVASSQMGPLMVYRLATSNDERIRTILDNTIFLLVPNFNPDGEIIVGEWLKKTAGTPYEGSGPPELYSHYVGHDNNRDGYMLSQVESQHWARVAYHEWYPQIFMDVHQMGSYGSRLSIPPKYDPINPNVDPLVWRGSQLLGGAMGTVLEAEGITGVESSVHYDAWFMASFHTITNQLNIPGFHTESASAKMIWPLYIHPQQLQPASRGRPEYKAQMTFPHPWPGGWWRMGDIVRQQEVSTLALVEAAARYREMFQKNRALAASRQIERGATEAPYAHVIPMRQHDPGTAVKFASTLMLSGVEVHRATEPFRTGRHAVETGDLVIRLDQPARALVKSLIEPLMYPDNEWTRRRDGNPLRPYDLASFTLGDHMGVESFPIEEQIEKLTAKLEKLAAPPKLTGSVAGTGAAGWLLTPAWNDSFRAVNRILKTGGAVYRLPNPPAPLTPGTFWIPASSAVSRSTIDALAKEFGLPFTSSSAPPAARAWQLKPLRVGLYRRYLGGNMDEGWTRFIFDQWEFPYTRVEADEIRKGGLNDRYDALLFADDDLRSILGADRQPEPGLYPGADNYPPEYRKGLGDAGVEALKEFVRNGGSLILLDGATALATERFGIPVRNVVAGLPPKEFFAPGSTLRVQMDPTHPLAYGMPRDALIVFFDSAAFDIGNSIANNNISVVARYGDRDLLRGGWLDGERFLAQQTALVDVGYGKGRIALIGFRTQNRAQSHGTFKVLFNAIYQAGATEAVPGARTSSGQ
jgi:hypothetical protein